MLVHFPRITTDGLVLCLDAGNPLSCEFGNAIWKDLSGNQNDFTLSNGAYCSNENSASSIIFDGDNDNAGRSVPSILQLRNDKTLCFWFNRDWSCGDYAGALIRCGIGADLLYCLFAQTNGALVFHWYDGVFRSAGSPVCYTQNVFNYGCITIEGTTGIFYMNGQSVGSITVSVPSPTSANLIGIGATRSGSSTGSAAQDFCGKISSVKIYNRALSVIEIQNNYLATKGRYGL